ncbi:MAG: hypothetical protein H0X24_04470 [Ktedonobacterales bacterium]|nr:hypothetical protein [Ktedonobacterales bacterium]
MATIFTRLRYELRIIGWLNLLVPVFAVVGFVALVVLVAWDDLHNGVANASVNADNIRYLRRLPEYMLPLAGSIVASALTLADPVCELHLTLPRAYRATAVRRMGVLTLWLAVLGVAIVEVIRLFGFWHLPWVFPQDQLTWAAPTLALVALGASLALLLRNRAASSAILGVVWIGEILFGGFLQQYDATKYTYLFLSSEVPSAGYWLGNRLALMGVAVVLLAMMWALLGRNEALLGNES